MRDSNPILCCFVPNTKVCLTQPDELVMAFYGFLLYDAFSPVSALSDFKIRLAGVSLSYIYSILMFIVRHSLHDPKELHDQTRTRRLQMSLGTKDMYKSTQPPLPHKIADAP